MAKRKIEISPLIKKVLIALVVIGTILALIIPLRIKVASFYINEGNSNIQNHFYKSAITNYEKASLLSPKDTDLKIQLGNIYEMYNDYNNAAKYYEEAVNINPSESRFWSKLLETLLSTKNLKLVSEKIVEMPEEHLKDENVALQYARVLASLSEMDEAVGAISSFENIQFYQSLFYLAQKDYEKASTYFEFDKSNSKHQIINYTLNKISDSNNPLYKEILVAQALNDIDEPFLAEQILTKIVSNHPEYRDANLFLGYSYLLQKRNDDAQKYLEKAKEIDRAHATTYYFLAMVQEDKEEKGKNLKLAYNLGGDSENMLSMLARYQLESENFEESEKIYSLLLKNNDENESYQYGYIESLIKNNKTDHALRVVEQFGNNSLLGYVYIQKNELEKAKNELEEFKSKNYHSAMNSYFLGKLSEKNNDTESAQKYYKESIEFDIENLWVKKSEEKLTNL